MDIAKAVELLLDSIEKAVMKRAGLVQKTITVTNKQGKTFQKKVWIKVGEDSKEKPTPKPKQQASIGNLQNLRYLGFVDSQLSALPESFGQLQNLKILDLSDNNLTLLLKSIGGLQKLEYLSGNPIPVSERKRLVKLLPNCNIYS